MRKVTGSCSAMGAHSVMGSRRVTGSHRVTGAHGPGRARSHRRAQGHRLTQGHGLMQGHGCAQLVRGLIPAGALAGQGRPAQPADRCPPGAGRGGCPARGKGGAELPLWTPHAWGGPLSPSPPLLLPAPTQRPLLRTSSCGQMGRLRGRGLGCPGWGLGATDPPQPAQDGPLSSPPPRPCWTISSRSLSANRVNRVVLTGLPPTRSSEQS